MRKRTDANHKEIVKALRDVGISVIDLSSVGNGCPDIVAGGSVKTKPEISTLYQRQNVLIEIKDGSRPPSQRKLTKDEARTHKEWRGKSICIVTNVADALALFGIE